MLGTILSKPKPLFMGLAALLVLAGCPDPEETFNEFVERTEGFGLPQGELGKSQLENLAGRFFLSASTQLGPTTPLLFDVTIESNMTQEDVCPSEGCKINMKLQPVRSPQVFTKGCPANFEPVPIAIGDVISEEQRTNLAPVEIRDIEVRSNGSFTANFPTLTVDGCANPITGREITANLVLQSVTKSADVFCGNLEGRVSRPIQVELTSSTFAAVRITEAPKDLDQVPDLMACPPDEGEGGAGGDGGTGGDGGQGGAGGTGGAP